MQTPGSGAEDHPPPGPVKPTFPRRPAAAEARHSAIFHYAYKDGELSASGREYPAKTTDYRSPTADNRNSSKNQLQISGLKHEIHPDSTADPCTRVTIVTNGIAIILSLGGWISPAGRHVRKISFVGVPNLTLNWYITLDHKRSGIFKGSGHLSMSALLCISKSFFGFDFGYVKIRFGSLKNNENAF